jgi:DHA2 family multidrug resistance protein
MTCSSKEENRLLSWMAMGMVACAFLLSENKPGKGATAGESVH